MRKLYFIGISETFTTQIYLKMAFSLALALLKLRKNKAICFRMCVLATRENLGIFSVVRVQPIMWWNPVASVLQHKTIKKSHIPFKLPAADPQWEGVWNLAWGKLNTDVQPGFQWVFFEIVVRTCISQRHLQTILVIQAS